MLGAIGRFVAPEVSPLQDVKDHWARFLEYYSSRTVLTLKAEPIEQTRLTFHLNKILAILVHEQEESSNESLEPCLEFFLHQDILNILVTLCQADTPPGIRPYIFKVFIFLLDEVKYPLLYETACHLPLCRLTLVCSLTKASPTESQEIEFLSLLCGKIRKSPHLVQVFLPEESDGGKPPSNISSRSTSRSTSLINLDQIETLAINVKQALESVDSRHYLGTALLNYLDSSDYCLSCQAMQNLIHLSGLDSDESASALISGSPLIKSILDRLSFLFKSIPGSIDAGRVEELEVNWIQAHKLHEQEFLNENFDGRSELISFLGFLDYVDSLVGSSHIMIGSSLAAGAGQLLLHLLQPLIDHQDSTQKVRGLAYLSVFWSHVKSTLLRDAIVSNFFDESETEEEHISMFSKVLDLWNVENVELRLDGMRIFDTLLSSPHQLFIDNLIGQYLEGRGYYNHTVAEGEAGSWSDVEEERERSKSEERSRSRSKSPSQFPKSAEERFSRTMAPGNIHRVVNHWLYLVEDQLRLDELRGSGYDLYLKDAGRQCEDVLEVCEEYNWGREAVAPEDIPETASTDSRCESDPSRSFDCGPFLNKVFHTLGNVLTSDYDSNLQLTSIIARLIQLPHPFIHEFLLNPTIPLQEGTSTLYTVLRGVIAEAKTRCSSVDHYPRKMLYTRKRMLGDPLVGMENLFQNKDEERMFECVVIVDEFCKELAANSLVKYHLFSAAL